MPVLSVYHCIEKWSFNLNYSDLRQTKAMTKGKDLQNYSGGNFYIEIFTKTIFGCNIGKHLVESRTDLIAYSGSDSMTWHHIGEIWFIIYQRRSQLLQRGLLWTEHEWQRFSSFFRQWTVYLLEHSSPVKSLQYFPSPAESRIVDGDLSQTPLSRVINRKSAEWHDFLAMRRATYQKWAELKLALDPA